MSVPNTLVIVGLSDTGTVTVTDTLFADPDPKEELFHLVNNVPQISSKTLADRASQTEEAWNFEIV